MRDRSGGPWSRGYATRVIVATPSRGQKNQITAWLIVRCVRDQNPVAIGPPATT